MAFKSKVAYYFLYCSFSMAFLYKLAWNWVWTICCISNLIAAKYILKHFNQRTKSMDDHLHLFGFFIYCKLSKNKVQNFSVW